MSSLTKGKLSSGLDQFSLSLASGTLTLNDADGNTISQNNPVQIKLRHTDGTLKTYMITTSFTFRDDANATKSDFLNSGSTDGMEFGKTAATAWGNDYPVCIGWIHDGSTAYPAFSLDPTFRSSGAATNIGYKEVKASTASDSNIVAWTTTNITTSHANKMFIPFATCTAVMSSAEDWTLSVSALSGDGVGNECLITNYGKREYTQPLGQMGAASGNYILANGGTPPVFSTYTNYFSIELNGFVSSRYLLSSDGGTDGSGSVDLLIALPTKAASISSVGNGYYRAAAGSSYMLTIFSTASQSYAGFFSGNPAVGGMTLGVFTNGDRSIFATIRYKAF